MAPGPAADVECDDGNNCTVVACDKGNPEAGDDWCVHEYHQRRFADILPPFRPDPPDPPCPQPGLDDLGDGVEVSGYGINEPPESTDLFPCAGGNGMIGPDDILNMLGASLSLPLSASVSGVNAETQKRRNWLILSFRGQFAGKMHNGT